MENLKIKVNSESERGEILGLLNNLGYNLVNNIACEKGFVVASLVSCGINFDYWADVKESTIHELRDMVALKRNDVNDATHICGLSKVLKLETKDYKIWDATYNVWVDYIGSQTDFRRGLKQIDKEVKMKEYIAKVSGDWRLVESHELVSGRIEVPEGAEILYFDKRYEPANHFFKTENGKSYYKYLDKGSKWMEYSDNGLNNFKENIDSFRIMWQRNITTPDTSTQDKLKFIEKWLNGEKIQYILGVETEKTQWHNFTEGAMQCIKRPDIKFREAPKYVTINGIEFKSVEKLMKYVKNNFDLEDGE